jgi:small subunit ribosomal protein S8
MDVFSSITSTLINAQRAGRAHVTFAYPHTGVAAKIRDFLRLLHRQGFIESVTFTSSVTKGKKLFVCSVFLKYGPSGEPAFHSFFRVSSSGRRVFIRSNSLWQPQTSVGVLLISTPYGILTDHEARLYGVGGEVIAGIR